MNELYPFESCYLEINGFRLHYLDEGHGDPVVMLHGNPTWSFFYRNLVMSFRESHRMIAPDHIGCGLSDKPDDEAYNYRLEQRIEDLEAFLDQLGIDSNITLVLHDWGGMIGMGYAVRHPDRIRRIVVLNTSAFHLPKTKPLPWQIWLGRNTKLGEFLILRMNAFCRGAARMCASSYSMSKRVKEGYLHPYGSVNDRIGILRFVQDIPLKPGDPSFDAVTSIEEGLEKLKEKPMLICWGDRDFVFDMNFLQEWRNRFPGATVHRFHHAGHYVLEDAQDEIVSVLDVFLKKT